MSDSKPLFTIVTACLNSERTIRTTIESVLKQTFTDYEYIIKDGGSKDGTIDIVNAYMDRFQGRLRLIQKKDKCMYEAMNQGVEEARGELIGIINSDDFYSEDTLQRVAEIYKSHPRKCLVIIGDMERVSETGESIYRYHFTQDMVNRKECFGHPSMFATKATYDRIGLYDTSYSLAADGDWQYRAMEDGETEVLLCPHVFNHMREGGASDNRKLRWKWFSERSRMKIEHNRGSRVDIWCSELFKVIKTDIKAALPKGFAKRLYKAKYGR